MTQFAEPSTDTTVTGWSASSGSFLFNCVNEGVASASDAEFINTAFIGGPPPQIYVTKVSGALNPNVTTGHVIVVRGSQNGLSSGLSLTCSLHQSYVNEGNQGAIIQTFMTNSYTDAYFRPDFREDTFAIASDSASLITDYASLYLRVESNVT